MYNIILAIKININWSNIYTNVNIKSSKIFFKEEKISFSNVSFIKLRNVCVLL